MAHSSTRWCISGWVCSSFVTVTYGVCTICYEHKATEEAKTKQKHVPVNKGKETDN